MPNSNIYIPIQSGSDIYPSLGYLCDNTGENISKKNQAYNNLCPLFWSWKNSDADIIGAVHYRRMFLKDKTPARWENVLDECDILNIFLHNAKEFV